MKAAVRARPMPPVGPRGAQLLSAVRTKVALQATNGTEFRPNAAERRVLDWLLYESGADLDIDRDPHYAGAYAYLARRRPRVLDAIVEPAKSIDGASYPMDTSDVVQLLRKAGLRVDEAGTAVRRLADDFEVPRLGSGQRRAFFARHVLQVASALELDFTHKAIEILGRHVRDEFDPEELVIAALLPNVSEPQAAMFARQAVSRFSRLTRR